VTGASASGALSAVDLGVIDLDATKLPSNDRDIFEAVLERILADPVDTEVEVLEPATSVTAIVTDVAGLAGRELTCGATASEQTAPNQGESIGGLMIPTASEAVEEVLREPAATPSSLIVGAPLVAT
jgi:hypothetical protein